ncbi:hypothetical protein J8F10_34220 [Gemmata sp. G18]|uniref:Uncharacterized protein n=1 Tax=Gemmata palustris TaxID=2822762 RepID=A0ABS5C3R1_9BACT|nr:hypothetical protein [Gemmata palustris]MBP3960312.1 hypothetical protein [Gemmata palustris]
MKRRNRKNQRVVPQSGAESFHEGEAGPLIYSYPMPPAKSRGQLIPRPEWTLLEPGAELTPVEQGAVTSSENRPLVPASEEVASLPRTAREAFAARCAARVARLRAGAAAPEAAAALILAAATTATPIRRQLLCIRRDLDRLKLLAKQNKWTDDTVIPPDVFGPMWPESVAPDWAKDPPAPPASE